jgi:hypothetical protein
MVANQRCRLSLSGYARRPLNRLGFQLPTPIRAGVFVRFHPSQSEAGLLMYSEGLAGGDPQESRSMLYKLKSAAGWRRKA